MKLVLAWKGRRYHPRYVTLSATPIGWQYDGHTCPISAADPRTIFDVDSWEEVGPNDGGLLPAHHEKWKRDHNEA